jgi:hypothetical protein
VGGSVLTRLRQARYLGSHPGVSGHADGLTIEFRTDGLRMFAGHNPGIFVPWADVRALDALDLTEVRDHVTASRVLLLGLLAFGAKKRTVQSYLVVTDADGQWIFAVPGLSSVELSSGLRPLLRYVPERPEAPDPLPVYVPEPPEDRLPLADRLSLLDELFESGAITQAERDQQRARLLDSI